MHRSLPLFALLLPLVSVAQKGREKESTEKDLRDALIHRAEVATTNGDLDSAEVLLAKALWMWPDSRTNLQQARVLLMRTDTTGYCRQMGMYTQEGAEEKAFYDRHCTRRDSIPFAQCGLSATEFPGIANVKRVWYKADSTTTYTMYDRSDSLRYRVIVGQQDTLYGYLDHMARFPGGEREMFKFLGKNTKYPSEAIDARISGIVYITFIVERDGRLVDAKVLRGLHHTVDAEAMRVIGGMPVWEPARKNDKPVRCRYNLPVRFTLR